MNTSPRKHINTEITIDEEPEKIVSMGPNMTEILYAIGAGDKLVGRTDYCDYPAAVSEVESVGSISNAGSSYRKFRKKSSPDQMSSMMGDGFAACGLTSARNLLRDSRISPSDCAMASSVRFMASST